MYPTRLSAAGSEQRAPRAGPLHLRISAQLFLAALILLGAPSCGGSGEQPRSEAQPNILWVVWDTVRADHMSLYGHSRPTTPQLDRWAENALVFDDAVSAAGYTVPSHASMFTGLLPSEHCANGESTSLRKDFPTIAEILRDQGYATFLFAENPHLSRQNAFGRGFERVEHPWSEQHRDVALRILRQKLEGDGSSELVGRLQEMERGEQQLSAWNLKAAGELAEHALLSFLDDRDRDRDRPFFAFLNYMEAHRPTIPPRKMREALMSPEQVEASYRVDRSWKRIWDYSFGLEDVTDEELEVIRATYDAAILELDGLFASLLEALEARGALDNTVIVLTSDHGEHLGEQHRFDHQSTLYEPVLRVPLVIHHPSRIPAGRRNDPVMNVDLFPTLLALAGVSRTGIRTTAHDLLASEAKPSRRRLAEETATESTAVRAMRELHPGWDAEPWLRSQRALYEGRFKWIWSSDGAHELFDLRADPGEERNLAGLREIDSASMQAALIDFDEGLRPCNRGSVRPQLSAEETRRLEILGYLPPRAESSENTGAEPGGG